MAGSTSFLTQMPTPNATATLLSESIRSRWAFNIRFLADNWQWSGICRAKVNSTIPVVRAACIPSVDISRQPGDTLALAFPVLPEDKFWHEGSLSLRYANGPSATYHLPKSMLEINQGNSKPNKTSSLLVGTHWLELPDTFASSSIGLVLLLSDGLSSSNSRFSHALSCSVDARWAVGENTVTTSQADWAWGGYSGTTQSVVSSRRPSYDDYGSVRLFLPVNDGSWRRVAISKQWADALTPSLADRGTSTPGAVLEDRIQSFIGHGRNSEIPWEMEQLLWCP